MNFVLIFSSWNGIFAVQIALLTLNQAGGGVLMCPRLRRSLAISRRIMLEFCNFLTFSKMMLGPGSKSHFEYILNDCPENGPSSTKIHICGQQKFTNFLRQKSLVLIFSKIFINKTSNFRSNVIHWSSEKFFEVLHAFLAQRLTNLEFSTINFSDVAIGQFGNLMWPN